MAEGTVGAAAVRALIADYKRDHPGRTLPGSSSYQETAWELEHPVERGEEPHISWHLTDLGKKAVEVIVKSVATVLTPRPEGAPKPAK